MEINNIQCSILYIQYYMIKCTGYIQHTRQFNDYIHNMAESQTTKVLLNNTTNNKRCRVREL